ncbi:MAG: radical SAM protein [Thermoguttaceae bacterium]
MVKKLEIIYVVPSRYDDEGYVKRYIWGVVPSNSLAVLKSLTESLKNEQPFPGVEINISAYDDNVQKIPFRKIARLNRRNDTKVVVGLVGVQTGQFPRAAEIALQFKKMGIDAMIGGFHVSGIMSLFDELTPELKELVDQGVTLIDGESETPGVLRDLFQDVLDGTLKPVYHFPKAPDIEHTPLPQADPAYIDHFGAHWATIDSSRGCPYGCTFCTVINIQGRKMRCRSAEGVLTTVQANYDKGVTNFFFTDDNFARSRIWRDVFNGLIEMKKKGCEVSFMMQIDTQSSKIPDFVDLAKEAGCRSVFIGMESVNPVNIADSGKLQNKVEEYREMVGIWQKRSVIVHVGYIIGFPNDTVESVRRDVHFLRDHVGVDLASFFMMTPLPGSVDHRDMVLRGDPIDPDLNKYDSCHETFQHPNMPNGKWSEATKLAYCEFYTKEHCAAILRRMPREHYWFMFWNLIWYRYSGVFSGTHPMMTGFFRMKNRLERRPGYPKENLLRYSWRWIREFVLDAQSYIRLFFEFQEIWFLTRKPNEELIPAEKILEQRGQELSPERSALLEPALVGASLSLGNEQIQPVLTESVATQPVQAGLLQVPTQSAQTQSVPTSPKTVRRSSWRLNFIPLMELRRRWGTTKQRVAEQQWSGHPDVAIEEIRHVLVETASGLRLRSEELSQQDSWAERKQAKMLQEVVTEIEEHLKTLEKSPKDKSLLNRSLTFVREKLIARYEELTHRYVKIRRRTNTWHKEQFTRLKRGRLFSFTGMTLLRAPITAFWETYLSIRFSVAALRKEIS